MSRADFQVSDTILNGARNYLMLLETFATRAKPLDSILSLKHELRPCLMGIFLVFIFLLESSCFTMLC